jgi:hypothetical protein
VVPLDEPGAHAVGALLGKSGTTDIGDAALVYVAMARAADIVTNDRTDIEHLVSVAGGKIRIVAT